MENSPLLIAYQEYEGELLRFLARRMKCMFMARDLVQELYLRLLRVENPACIENRRAYLYRVASNLASDHLRVEARRAVLLREGRELLPGSSHSMTPERITLARLELDHLRRAIEELPPLSRKIFYLNRFEGKSQRKIAEELKKSVTTIEKHIRRVLDHLAHARYPLKNRD